MSSFMEDWEKVIKTQGVKTSRVMIRERREFLEDRVRNGSRLVYLAHARGWVMVRHPRCVPFCIPEAEWAMLPKSSSTDRQG